MRQVFRVPAVEIRPGEKEALEKMGLAPDATPTPKTQDLLTEALDMFCELARPAGVFTELSVSEFSGVFRGESRNESPNPLEGIFPRAKGLALFAATLGEELGRRIEGLFSSFQPALAYALDAVSSCGAELLAGLTQSRCQKTLEREVRLPPGLTALRYSPGYCGWHLSGQKRLFASLEPEEIGLLLEPSFLMRPLKSVSGVIVLADAAVHEFRAGFPFCRGCRHRSCQGRRRQITGIKHGVAR